MAADDGKALSGVDESHDVRPVAVDFDGVIRVKASKEPVPGALNSLHWLMARYPVVIYSGTPSDKVSKWLTAYGFKTVVHHNVDPDEPAWTTMGVLLVTGQKPKAMAYIDDKAIHFDNWEQALAQLPAVIAEQTKAYAQTHPQTAAK